MKKIQYMQFIFMAMLVCWLPMQAQAAQTSGIARVAGGGFLALGDGGDALLAKLIRPSAVTTDSYGNIYISDQNQRRIRKVDIGTGIISTVVGTGAWLNTGDGGLATAATIAQVSSIAIAPNGDIYFADKFNHNIRKVTVSTGIITTVVGTGATGNTGDNGSGTLATLNAPEGIAFNNAGTFLYIADTGNHRIRKMQVSNGIVFAVSDAAGTPGYVGVGANVITAKFNKPTKLAFDSTDNYYIVDSLNYRIRKVDTFGLIQLFAGTGIQANPSTGDGLAAVSSAGFNVLSGIAIDSYANVYITDKNRVRRIDAASGVITTVAGSDLAGGGGGPQSVLAKLNGPTGISIDNNDNVYIADYWNDRVEKIFADTVAPLAPVITSPVNNPYSQSFSGLSGTADPYSVVYYRLDNIAPSQYDYALVGGDGSWWANGVATQNNEGTHSFTVYVVDGAGNIGPSVVANYVIDLTPPVITLIGNNPLTVTAGVFKDPGATAVDAVSGTISAGNIFTTGPSVFGTLNLQDGQTVVVGKAYNIMYYAVDPAGNYTDQASGTSIIRMVNVIADPNAPAGGSGNNTANGTAPSSGDGGGGGGCLAPTSMASLTGLLPMMGLFMLGLFVARHKEE